MPSLSPFLKGLLCSLLLQSMALAADPAGVFSVPQKPLSWDYRIARGIGASASQVVSQDLWGIGPAQVKKLQAQGKTVLCYFSAGSWEQDNFSRLHLNQVLTAGKPQHIKPVSQAILQGKSSYVFEGKQLALSGEARTFQRLLKTQLPGWEEMVYDLAGFTAQGQQPHHVLLRRVMLGHMEQARKAGCDGVEPDNLDVYTLVKGISATDQYRYNVWLAQTAHSLGLKVLLKNNLDQIRDGDAGVPVGEKGLVHFFDGIINEECFQFEECERLAPFRDRQKPIFVREYGVQDCASYRKAPYGDSGLSREQLASQLHLNVSGSRFGNGESPDANAEPTSCPFGSWK